MKKPFNGKLEVFDCSKGERVVVPDSKLVRFVVPKWIMAHDFFTHRDFQGGSGWSLSEAETGGSVVTDQPTEEKAVTEGFAKLINAGEDKFKKVIRQAKENQTKIQNEKKSKSKG
jgi:hypothetical protein